jgi:hypothetical protein
VDIHSSLFDPKRAHLMYNDFMDEIEYAAACRFNAVCVNEHHSNGYGLMPSPDLIASSLARRTTDAAICVMGNSLAQYNPPTRVAEEFAMIDGFGNEIQSPCDLTMPETPSDPLDRLGEASTSVTIRLRRLGPVRGRLCDVLNPHREMKPIQDMMGRPGTGCLTKRSWTIGTIAQDGDRCRWRRSQSMKHTAQPSRLRSRLRRHAGEYDPLPLIVADLSEENLERARLILTSRPHVAAVNGECDGFRRHHRDLDPAPATASCSSLGQHEGFAAGWQKFRQQRPRPAVGQQRTCLRDGPLVLRRASVRHDLGNRIKCLAAGYRAPTRGKARRADLHRTEQRHQSPGALIFEGSLRAAALAASPVPAMILRLSLNEMDLQRSKQMLALLQRQPDHRRRVFGHGRATADLMNANHPIRSDQLQHDTPLHPELPATTTGRPHSTPTFWTVSCLAG